MPILLSLGMCKEDEVDISLYLHEGLGEFHNPDENGVLLCFVFCFFVFYVYCKVDDKQLSHVLNILERNETRKTCKYNAYLKNPSFIVGKAHRCVRVNFRSLIFGESLDNRLTSAKFDGEL